MPADVASAVLPLLAVQEGKAVWTADSLKQLVGGARGLHNCCYCWNCWGAGTARLGPWLAGAQPLAHIGTYPQPV